jgi:hypothetical protein
MHLFASRSRSYVPPVSKHLSTQGEILRATRQVASAATTLREVVTGNVLLISTWACTIRVPSNTTRAARVHMSRKRKLAADSADIPEEERLRRQRQKDAQKLALELRARGREYKKQKQRAQRQRASAGHSTTHPGQERPDHGPADFQARLSLTKKSQPSVQ